MDHVLNHGSAEIERINAADFTHGEKPYARMPAVNHAEIPGGTLSCVPWAFSCGDDFFSAFFRNLVLVKLVYKNI